MKLSESGEALIKISSKDIDANGQFCFPDSVIKVAGFCCSDSAAKKLKTIHLNKVKKILSFAFNGCENLESVIGSPTTLGVHTFAECPHLDTFDFSNVEQIGCRAFEGSGFLRCISETDKLVTVRYGITTIRFARINANLNYAYRISDIIDMNKNAYTNSCGTPFVLDESGKKVELDENREKFMKLWNS